MDYGIHIMRLEKRKLTGLESEHDDCVALSKERMGM